MSHFPSHADQEDRQWAIKEFREGRKDVLVATDVASKGLDFQGIQHVINYDMPTDIENYGGRVWGGAVTSVPLLSADGCHLTCCVLCSAQNWPHWSLWEDRDCHNLHQQEMW